MPPSLGRGLLTWELVLRVLEVCHLVSFPPPPSSTGTDTAESSSVATVDADVPPPTTSDDSDIWRMLDHVLTVQVAHGQILVDMLNEIRALRAELAQFRPPPFW